MWLLAPTRDREGGSVGEQYRFAAGIQFRPREYVEFAVSYQFLYFADLEFDQVVLPSGTVVLDGDFDPAWANQAGVTLRVRF